MDADQIYRITFDGSVADEHGFAAIGGQADQVATELKERYSDEMSLTDAMSAALAALAAPGNGEATGQLEVAVLDRTRTHRTFRRLQGARLEELLRETRPAESSIGGGTASGSTGSALTAADDDTAVGPPAPSDGNPTPGTSTDPD
jgi:proteasome alpha subunit